MSSRDIAGLVVPWNVVGHSGRRKWLFLPDSLMRIDPPRLVCEHDNSQQIGRLVDDWTDEAGQWAHYVALAGRAGNRALAEVETGYRTGLSATLAPRPLTWVDDHPAYPGIRVVTSAVWVSTSLVRAPAFATARVHELIGGASRGNA